MQENIYYSRLSSLRNLMKARNIDAYLVLTDDYHASEYVGDYFKCRAYLSGFTGSAGTLVITAAEAGLWTDGRYFLQAAEQLQGSGITLHKMGIDAPIPDYLKTVLKCGGCVGYDGRTVRVAYATALKNKLRDLSVRFDETTDLVGELWSDRPAFPAAPIWELPTLYTGKGRREKLADLRRAMNDAGADCHLLASLDDIAWLFNLRGGDVLYNPVFMSHTLLTPAQTILYAGPGSVNDDLAAALQEDGITLRPYSQIYEDLTALPKDSRVLLDEDAVNVALCHALPAEVRRIVRTNPTTIFKAQKTVTEQENMRLAHVYDGVALTKLLYWLRTQPLSTTELDIADKLESLRAACSDYLGQSFAPIVATGAHGAIIHYEPTEESNTPLVNNSFLLMDTGGQYRQGTTDVTRTVAIGTLSQEQKTHYTAVLRGNLALAAAHFKHGCTGVNLDYLARSPLWELGLDYNHGTGHGVGYLLNVHEGPQGIRLQDKNGGAVLEDGLILSDEPGVYLENRYGIRLENLILCRKAEKTDWGQFMAFDTLTMVPFDRNAIDPTQMTKEELQLLNSYHAKVCEAIAPYLNDEERAWLREATAPLCK